MPLEVNLNTSIPSSLSNASFLNFGASLGPFFKALAENRPVDLSRFGIEGAGLFDTFQAGLAGPGPAAFFERTQGPGLVNLAQAGRGGPGQPARPGLPAAKKPPLPAAARVLLGGIARRQRGTPRASQTLLRQNAAVEQRLLGSPLATG